MDLGIGGKRALVTCGSGGLGLSCCEALAAEGANLIIFARNPATLAKVRARLEERHSVTVDVIAGEMGSPADIEALARYAEESGGVDILVLNTPRPPERMQALLDEIDPGRWTDAYQRQLQGAIEVILNIAPIIAARGWGRVIGITATSVK